MWCFRVLFQRHVIRKSSYTFANLNGRLGAHQSGIKLGWLIISIYLSSRALNGWALTASLFLLDFLVQQVAIERLSWDERSGYGLLGNGIGNRKWFLSNGGGHLSNSLLTRCLLLHLGSRYFESAENSGHHQTLITEKLLTNVLWIVNISYLVNCINGGILKHYSNPVRQK